MKSIKDMGYLRGVRVLVRVDFNVPMANGNVSDNSRIKMVLPTVDYLRNEGAKVILMSHLESNDHRDLSLEPVSVELKKLGEPVVFVKNLRSANGLIGNRLGDGQCALLENLRFFPEEKANDRKFAEELSSLGDVYVNEAFSVCHREHASIIGVPRLMPGYAGFRLEKEIANLSKAFNPVHPFLFILGGAKFGTKMPLLAKFLDIADTVFVGGALANDLFKAKGHETGKSLVSGEPLDLKLFLDSSKLAMPVDVAVNDGSVKGPGGLSADDKIMDAGPATVAALKETAAAARFILWNGPLGMYEEGFKATTVELARTVSEAAGRGATTIVGGGDTLAAISELGLDEKFTWLSAGGGAMLDFLAQGTLPGIEALG